MNVSFGETSSNFGKTFVAKLPYLLNKCIFLTIRSFTSSEFCAKHARRHDVSEHLGISGNRIQFPKAILFQTKTGYSFGHLSWHGV